MSATIDGQRAAATPRPARTSTRGVKSSRLRYTLITMWARKRYEDARGFLTVTMRGQPTRYARIEDAAAVKYLGMSPHLARGR